MTATAVSTMKRIRTTANKAKTDAARSVGALGDLDYTRQGDVYFWNLNCVPCDAVLEQSPSAQLAPGNTQGSRHIIDNVGSVRMFRMPSANPLQGPIIDAPEGVTITHPEHGHQTLPAGVYAVTYQRAYGEELRRVTD